MRKTGQNLDTSYDTTITLIVMQISQKVKWVWELQLGAMATQNVSLRNALHKSHNTTWDSLYSKE